MKFSYNWIRELVDGLDVPASELSNADHHEDRRVRRHRRSRRAAGSGACAARVESVEPIEGSKNVKAVVDAGRYGEQDGGLRRAELPAGMITAYVPPGPG